MKKEEMENIINIVREKIGEENSGMIADELVTIISDNNSLNQSIEEKDKKINLLKQDKENLLEVNGNLFQRLGIGEETEKEDKEEKENNPHDFNFKSAFNEKGEFI